MGHSAGVLDHRRAHPTRQITLICEVLTEPAIEGRFVARVEVVATGELVPIRDTTELVQLVRRLSTDW